MTQEALKGVKISPMVEGVGRKGVPQYMDAATFFDTGFFFAS